jgi:hypothetical protein
MFNEQSQNFKIQDAAYHNEWRYRDRSPIYTYTYWKWGDWVAWSDTAVAGDGYSREVQTQELFGYRRWHWANH